MTDPTQTTAIALARIQRIVDVISLISLSDFDPGRTLIPTGEFADEFARVEEALNILTRELAETHRQNEAFVEKLEASRRELEAKLVTIERQQSAIRDLSTPIIELWDEILTLPIVGVVDTQRSLEMTTRLLHRIAESRFRCVIVDLTGVDVVDTMTANHFVQMIRSAQLLGVYCVVTGVSPDIAQTLVRTGVDLGGVKTLRSLKEGLKDCFLYLRRKDDEEQAADDARGAAERRG
jgi:rsbT co-antagonist protein RsbR